MGEAARRGAGRSPRPAGARRDGRRVNAGGEWPVRPAWAITSYYNPMGYHRRRANYRLFRERLRAPLLAVELAYGLTSSSRTATPTCWCGFAAPRFSGRRSACSTSRSPLLPDECTKVAWIDCVTCSSTIPTGTSRVEAALDRRDARPSLQPGALHGARLDARGDQRGNASSRAGSIARRDRRRHAAAPLPSSTPTSGASTTPPGSSGARGGICSSGTASTTRRSAAATGRWSAPPIDHLEGRGARASRPSLPAAIITFNGAKRSAADVAGSDRRTRPDAHQLLARRHGQPPPGHGATRASTSSSSIRRATSPSTPPAPGAGRATSRVCTRYVRDYFAGRQRGRLSATPG